jgi:hypothetical protein
LGWCYADVDTQGDERCVNTLLLWLSSYAQKLVTGTSGGVFDLLDAVLERYSFDDLGEAA